MNTRRGRRGQGGRRLTRFKRPHHAPGPPAAEHFKDEFRDVPLRMHESFARRWQTLGFAGEFPE